jgi:hypothetical protein
MTTPDLTPEVVERVKCALVNGWDRYTGPVLKADAQALLARLSHLEEQAKLAAASPSTPRLGGERDRLAEAVHRGRFTADREPTPFADEDRHGREYCFRIADAVLALTSPTSGENGDLHRAADAAHKAMDYALSYAFILDPEEWDHFRRKSDALLAALSASPAGGES